MKANINPDYIITLQGQQYCTYRGILDCAHALGLDGIRTRLIQAPTPENEYVAIVEAEVKLKDGRVFVDVADASPKNVAARLSSALIRMASTRAKGRALRDAVNVGEAMAEELSDLETEHVPHPGPSPRAGAMAPRPTPAPAPARPRPDGDGAPHEPAPATMPVQREAVPPARETSTLVREPAAPVRDSAAPPREASVPAREAAPPPREAAMPAREAPAPAREAAPPPREAAAPPREVPSPTHAAEAPAPAAPAEVPTGKLVCSSQDCGRTITQGQYAHSLTRFGVALCPACQRKQQA